MKLFLPTIGLSVVLVLFLTYSGQVRIFHVKNSVRAQEVSQARPVLIYEPAQVKAFQIRHGQELIISARMDKNRAWTLEAPFRAPADAYMVDRALGILSRVTMAGAVARGEPKLVQSVLQEA